MLEVRDFAHGVLLFIGALLPIVNPVGNAPVFLAMTRRANLATRARLAGKVAINSFILLLGSLFLGNLLLEFFGVSLPAVQVAGGCIVCKLGWSLLADDDARANGTMVLMRLSAFIMFCIGVRITWTGASTLVRDFKAPPAVSAPAKAV